MRVLLSSTSEDLHEERAAVIDVIGKLQAATVGMEFFGASSSLPIETCLDQVRQSTFLVIVVAHRYGTLVPGVGISYTQAEYEEAIRLGKPCLAYVRDSNTPTLPGNVEQDATKVPLLGKFIETLQTRHTPYTWTDSHDLSLRVAIDLAPTAKAIAEQGKADAKHDWAHGTLTGNLEAVVDSAMALGADGSVLLRAAKRAVSLSVLSQGLRNPLVFLSYAHGDTSAQPVIAPFAEALRDRGVDVWLDREELRGGEDWASVIFGGLDTADVIAVFVPEKGSSGAWVETELRYAISRRAGSVHRTAVVPVVVSNPDVPGLLRDSKFLDLQSGAVQEAADDLVARMRIDLPWAG